MPKTRTRTAPLITWAPIINQYLCPGGNPCPHGAPLGTHVVIEYAHYCTDPQCIVLARNIHGATEHRGHTHPTTGGIHA